MGAGVLLQYQRQIEDDGNSGEGNAQYGALRAPLVSGTGYGFGGDWRQSRECGAVGEP